MSEYENIYTDRMSGDISDIIKHCQHRIQVFCVYGAYHYEK